VANVTSRDALLINDGIKGLNADGVTDYDTNWAKWANVGVVSAMSDIDTITGIQAPFYSDLPNYNWLSAGANHWGWHKWYFGRQVGRETDGDGGAGSRSWVLVGDDRMFYLFMSWNTNGNLGRTPYCFGDIESLRPGDLTQTILCAEDIENSNDYISYPGERCQYGFPREGQAQGKVILRSHTQVGLPVRWFTVGTITGVSGGQTNAVPFPNAADYSLIALSNVMCRQEEGNIRGVLPGMLYLPQSRPYSNLTIVDTVTNLPGRKIVMVSSHYNSDPAGALTGFDITGPWR
jgi:hypothetical protein